MATSNTFKIVIVGHVDHGKSTIIGRLLADTGSLPEGKLEAVKANCERNSKPFEYAFLLDALKDEQAQGITIDMARCFFKSDKRDYILIDAPGHIEFLKNMVTGAARAEAALLVIDAKEGVQENSRRHGYLLSMLGIKQVAVVINKMDLVDYSESVFNQIVSEYSAFLKELDVEPTSFIPISAFMGENIVKPSNAMSWFKGQNILSTLDGFTAEEKAAEQPFRMFLQDVYKFTADGDDRRISAGRVESGQLSNGQEVIFLPSKKKTNVLRFEGFNEDSYETVKPGKSTGFQMSEQIYVKRGELVCRTDQVLPQVSRRFRANIFWMGREPFVPNKDYIIKIGTEKVTGRLARVNLVINAGEDLSKVEKAQIERHEVAECIIETRKPIAFDLNTDIEATSRFVIVDDYDISGGGIIRESMETDSSAYVEESIQRELRFERSQISNLIRRERYRQKPALVLFCGAKGADHKNLAKALEESLFNSGHLVYFIGMGNVKYSVDRDISMLDDQSNEHIRRFSEVAYLMMDAGLIVAGSMQTPTDDQIRLIESLISPHEVLFVRVDQKPNSVPQYEMMLDSEVEIKTNLVRVRNRLNELKITTDINE